MDRQIESRPYTGWQLIRAFWQSDQRMVAYSLLIFVLVVTMSLVGLDVAITTWYNYFYDALQEYDKRGCIDLLVIFVLLATIYIVIAVYRYYVQQFLALRWRRWLTNQFLNRWLSNRSYYLLENFDENTDNPDQRIQEDIGSLVVSSLNLTVGLVSSVATIFAFIYVLWKLSGVIVLPLGAWGTYHISGYLVWVGIIYATIGTVFTFKIGRPLVSLNFEQQRREANFRFAAIDVRSHAEHIALYRGEDNQKTILNKLFTGVLDNWYAIILRQKLLLWFTAGYNQVSVLVPLVVALPNYFNKVFKLGGLIQALSAFGKIQDALSFIVNSYTSIAEWQAVMRRLLTFLNHMTDAEESAKKQDHFVFQNNTDNKVMIGSAKINKPNGQGLLSDINQTWISGQDYVITGPSGIGKSTFVRMLAGIWPYGSGTVSLPANKKVMFLPQTSYMPLGSLRDALLFPDKLHAVSDEKMIELLKACDLPNLVTKLDTVARWTEQLSPGELQRIAFVRVLLHRPDWVFLDETTSALDIPHEKQLYALLKTYLPACTVVSVGHRPSLSDYHDINVPLENYAMEVN